MELDAITMVHLPDGPTAYFKLTSIQLTKQIFVGRKFFHLTVSGLSFANELIFRVMLGIQPIILSSSSIILLHDWVTRLEGCFRPTFRPYQNFKVDKSSHFTISVISCFSGVIGVLSFALDYMFSLCNNIF